IRIGLASGAYRGEPSDSLELDGAIVLNAVKCLPPGNRPLPVETATCRNYLEASLGALPRLKVLIVLGQIAHASTAKALGLAPSKAKFAHGAETRLPDGRLLLSSYHCSRQNTNTGRLTVPMFNAV